MDVTTTRTRELKKHAAVIHSASQLTLIQRKLCNALLYKAYPELQTLVIHEITIRELLDLIGFSSHNHTVVKEALKSLIKTIIEWNVLDENNEEDWTASSILASVRLKGPYCYYSYSAHLRELLHQPSMYGRLNMEIQSQFKSAYGLVLYENCMRYRRLQYTRWFELPMFRKLMGIMGDQYPIFRDFKRRVLDVGIKEVNQFSDLEITPEFKRTARAVIAIRFLLRTKIIPVEHKLVPHFVIEDSLLQSLSTNFGLTTKLANELIAQYGSVFIQQKMDLILSSSSYANGTIKNLTAYLLKSLQANFKPAKSSADHIQIVRQQQQVLERQSLLNIRIQEERRKQYAQYTKDFIKTRMDALLETQLKQACIEYYATKGNHFIVERFQKKGLIDKIVWANFESFVKALHPELISGLCSLEDFDK